MSGSTPSGRPQHDRRRRGLPVVVGAILAPLLVLFLLAATGALSRLGQPWTTVLVVVLLLVAFGAGATLYTRLAESRALADEQAYDGEWAVWAEANGWHLVPQETVDPALVPLALPRRHRLVGPRRAMAGHVEGRDARVESWRSEEPLHRVNAYGEARRELVALAARAPLPVFAAGVDADRGFDRWEPFPGIVDARAMTLQPGSGLPAKVTLMAPAADLPLVAPVVARLLGALVGHLDAPLTVASDGARVVISAPDGTGAQDRVRRIGLARDVLAAFGA
ncbi:hypothetical protein EXU48_10350 [Occultella glacieicola]|uniref:Type VII secretion protein EccE n=1 Tax=Occultella glacieicola TaxID=2518684 RepID=A0ABY2E7L5_9MICO|nr:hypothetical protein [Occultella glacieicola]TDE93871.1 hypothetical protein EXU48_10350 [Occultella glacieicola]